MRCSRSIGVEFVQSRLIAGRIRDDVATINMVFVIVELRPCRIFRSDSPVAEEDVFRGGGAYDIVIFSKINRRASPCYLLLGSRPGRVVDKRGLSFRLSVIKRSVRQANDDSR